MFGLGGSPIRPWLCIWVLAVAPGRAQDCGAILDRARKAFNAGQYQAASEDLEKALTGCPKDRQRIHLALGQTLYLLGRESEAERWLQAALAADPQNEEALYALGRIYAMKKRFPEAVEKLKEVTRIHPENYKAWDNLGVCYDAMNSDSDALRSFFKALDLVVKDHPGYDWAHANLADFFLRRQENEKAFQLAAEAAKRNPGSARNCFLTGKALVRLEKPELALRWLERAVELESGHSEALYMLSQTYRKLGRNAEAQRSLARFEEAVRTRPPHR